MNRNLGPDKAAAALLLAGTVLAVAWANLSASSYAGFWETHVEVAVGDVHLELGLAHWSTTG